MRKRKAGERRERSGCEHPTCDYDAVNSHMTDDSMKSSLTYTITCYATYELLFGFFNLHSSQRQVLHTTATHRQLSKSWYIKCLSVSLKYFYKL